jgi:hypothetical protein
LLQSSVIPEGAKEFSAFERKIDNTHTKPASMRDNGVNLLLATHFFSDAIDVTGSSAYLVQKMAAL